MVGERRVVTMLFCDIKGSTAAAEQLDPEDWTEIINGAFEHMIKPVYKYEGTVARLMGDAILAFFGAPIAHEDDPQRAVLAGLDIVAGIEPYRHEIKQRWDIDVNVRVGINTGRVVVGNVGSDLRTEYTAMGDAINLASRMEQTAEPGTLQIAEDTYKVVKHAFDVQDLGGIAVKGKEKPVAAYRVLGRRSVAGRRRGIEGMRARMVGRDVELSTLQGVVASVQQGVGRIVCVIGEAGLGKSRLIHELNRTAQDLENSQNIPVWYETGSLSYETGHPYGLFQRLIRRLNGTASADSSETARQKIASMVAGFDDAEGRRVQRVIETLFDLEMSTADPPLEGQAFKRELFRVMPLIWQQRFAEQPVVLVLEDLHWSDPVSVELLIHLFPLTAEIPVVLLCAFRPDRQSPAWRLKVTADDEYHHRYTEIGLRPLSDPQVEELVGHLLTGAELPDILRSRILERSGGNPFFVEEVIRSLIDSGAVIGEEKEVDGQSNVYWRATGEGELVEIPDNLQALLAARIDRLEEETRQTLQMASVIGRTFSRRVLESIGNNGTVMAIETQLSLLLQIEIIRETARLPELEYKFSNPLTQEVAYQTILIKQRRAFHDRVGRAMEALFPDRLAEMAPRLAFHFLESGNKVKAAQYFTLAGDSSYRLYALTEAIGHYTQALQFLDQSAGASEELVHIYTRRGRAMELSNTYAEALENYAKMERIAGERGDDGLRLAALLARTIVHTTFTPVFDPNIGLPLSEEALDLARQREDHGAQAKVLWSLMLVHAYAMGDTATGARYGHDSLQLARKYNLTEQLPYILNDLGRIMAFNNQIHEGLPLIAEARPLFEKSGNLPLLSDNRSGYSLVAYFAGDLQTARKAAEDALRISRSINNQIGIEDNTWRACMAYAEQGELGRAAAGLESVIAISEGIWLQAWPYLAHIYAELGATAETLKRYVVWIDDAKSSGPFFRDAYAAQLARLYLQLDDQEAAERVFQDFPQESDPTRISALNVWGFLANAELLFHRQDFGELSAILDMIIAQEEAVGLAWLRGDLQLLQARTLLELEPAQSEKAQAVLEKAYTFANEGGHNRVLWKIALALSELVDEPKASELRNQAREIIDRIANGLDDPELRRSFLIQPQIQSLTELA
jgi:predicted ATPase/class 3 adenylate cyclase